MAATKPRLDTTVAIRERVEAADGVLAMIFAGLVQEPADLARASGTCSQFPRSRWAVILRAADRPDRDSCIFPREVTMFIRWHPPASCAACEHSGPPGG